MTPPSQLQLRFTGLTPRSQHARGHVYAGRDFTGTEVTVAVLDAELATDAGMRRAFADAVRRHSVHSSDVDATQPWAAVRTGEGEPDAAQLLAFAAPAAAGSAAAAPAFDPPSVFGPATTLPPPAESPPAGSPPAGSLPSGAAGGAVALVVVLTVLAVVAVGAGAMFVALRADPEVGDGVAALPTAMPPRSEPTTTPTPTNLPELRDVAPLSVVGPAWQDGDETYTMAFADWPFAFRTPPTWGCVSGTYSHIPDAPAWQCRDEAAQTGQRINIMIWPCPTTCTDGEQSAMIETWLDEPDQAITSGSVTYVETERNSRGLYSIDLSHFAADPADPDGPLQWHVGVYAESPLDTRDDVLRILNDIVSQTS